MDSRNTNAVEANRVARLAVRGAIGFGLGATVAGIGASTGILGATLFGVLSGAVGGALLGWRRKIRRSAWIAAFGFGFGFVIPALLGQIILVAPQGAPSDDGLVFFGSVGWGLLLGIAGAIGAPFLRSGTTNVTFRSLAFLVLAGGLAFGAGGAIGGATAFTLAFVLDVRVGIVVFLILFYGLSYCIGGALLGAAVGYLEGRTTEPKDEEPRDVLSTPARSGLAIAAGVLGILSVVMSLVYPIRYKLPFLLPMLFARFEVATIAAGMLAVVGLPPLVLGAVAVRGIRRNPVGASGTRWALSGIVTGAILTLYSLLLLLEPVSLAYDVRYATTLLNSAGENDSLNGQVVHDGNLILGQVALKRGDIGQAKHFLLEAGKTSGSPVLGSFGPDMTLAADLLKVGEREGVVEYLYLCRKFWEMDRNPGLIGEGRLSDWTQTILEGRMPDFGHRARGPSLVPREERKEGVNEEELIYRHSSGENLGKARFRNGVPDGTFTTWHVNGRKWLEWELRDGKRTGKWVEWYESGQKYAEGEYVDGVKHGEISHWRENATK